MDSTQIKAAAVNTLNWAKLLASGIGEDLNIIFNNETALKQVRWRYFLADCNHLQGDVAKIAELEAQELAKAEQWLQQTHQDIMANFDPKVVRLRKKRKIVMAPGVLDDLLKGDGDE